MFLLPALAAAILLQNPQPLPPGHGASMQSYVPQRVYDTQKKAWMDFEVMLADAAKADVVFVGEQHDDPNTHRLETAILDGLVRRKVAPVVSLEMFERDVQGNLNEYLAGKMSEEEMLKLSRPWPRYATDYRGLVERAKAHGWPVIASNVPRRIASLVAKTGKESIAQLSPQDRTYVAADLHCPRDSYFDRFAETMGGHPAGNMTKDQQDAMLERYYWSQCVKDETMAEAIASAAATRTATGPVVHYNGAFHSDFGLGTAERVRRRMVGKRTVVISVLPVKDLDALGPDGEDLERGDYLVYTIGR
jgi:uncharacterized iron-regulated protein